MNMNRVEGLEMITIEKGRAGFISLPVTEVVQYKLLVRIFLREPDNRFKVEKLP